MLNEFHRTTCFCITFGEADRKQSPNDHGRKKELLESIQHLQVVKRKKRKMKKLIQTFPKIPWIPSIERNLPSLNQRKLNNCNSSLSFSDHYFSSNVLSILISWAPFIHPPQSKVNRYPMLFLTWFFHWQKIENEMSASRKREFLKRRAAERNDNNEENNDFHPQIFLDRLKCCATLIVKRLNPSRIEKIYLLVELFYFHWIVDSITRRQFSSELLLS